MDKMISSKWLKTAIHNFYKGLNHTPTEEDIQAYIDAAPCEDCIRRSDIGLTDFEIIMCKGDYREALKILLEKIAKAPSIKPQEPINKIVQKAYEDGKKDGYVQAKVEQEKENHMNNSEWIDFLSKQFDISRTSAKEMLHVMMSVKREDNFKKQFSGRKGENE